MFIYLVINRSGTPIFQYPNIDNLNGVKIDSVLFSALMSALNSFSMEVIGNILGEVRFGSVISTLSKDDDQNLHVLLTGENVDIELNKELHIEIKTLFLATIAKLGISLDFSQLPEGELLEKSLYSVFDPFTRLWEKRIKEGSV